MAAFGYVSGRWIGTRVWAIWVKISIAILGGIAVVFIAAIILQIVIELVDPYMPTLVQTGDDVVDIMLLPVSVVAMIGGAIEHMVMTICSALFAGLLAVLGCFGAMMRMRKEGV